MKLAQVGSIANKANAADAKSRAADCSVKLMKAGKKAGRKIQKRRVGLVAFGPVPENFVARGLDSRTKGKSRASRFLACHENE